MKQYHITQEIMDDLIKWRDDYALDLKEYSFDMSSLDSDSLEEIPTTVYSWWRGNMDPIENNNRLIAIMNWLNGENVFIVRDTLEYIIRGKDDSGRYIYVSRIDDSVLPFNITHENSIYLALIFNSYHEALPYVERDFEIIELDQ